MIRYSDLLDFLYKMGTMLAETFGSSCEVVVSDLDSPEQAILYIFNGSVSGRNPGDPLPLTQKAMLSSGKVEGGSFVNRRDNKNGKEIKSTMLIHRFGGHNLTFCINYDCSDLIPVYQILTHLLQMNDDLPVATQTQEQIMADMINKTLAQMGKPASLLNKSERKQVLLELQKQGVMDLRKSVTMVAKYMGISRYTIYNYLNELNSK